MNTHVRKHYTLKFLVCMTIAVMSSVVAQGENSDHNPQAGQKSDLIIDFQEALRGDGFDIEMGSVSVLDPSVLYCQGRIPSAIYANKGAPYLSAIVPKLEEESPRLSERIFRLRYDEETSK